MKAGCRRQVTDEQIAKVKAWRRGNKPLYRLAMDLGISETHARRLRTGRYQHKQASPQ